MSKGTRFIGGKEFLLGGRVSDKAAATSEAKALRASWEQVRIVKLSSFDYMLYVHGCKALITKP